MRRWPQWRQAVMVFGGPDAGPPLRLVGLFPQKRGHVVVRVAERVVGLRADVGGEATAPGGGSAGLGARAAGARQVEDLARRRFRLALGEAGGDDGHAHLVAEAL